MRSPSVRRPAVAGTWYPGTAETLGGAVDTYLDRVDREPMGDVLGLIAPHAGLMYSGPVAAHAYRAVQGHDYDVAVLVGPSHFVGFDGVSIYEQGVFDTPLGPVSIATNWADAIRGVSSVVYSYPPAHVREHSLEMQLPFLRRVLPDVPIVPLVMGYQTRETILELARALAVALKGARVLLIASTDLSHYFDARTASVLDGKVIDCVKRLDPEGLLLECEKYPEDERGRYVACGGGPAISVIRAARELGATEAMTLRYADSGDVSGDKQAVVGYLAAALGRGLTAL